VSSLMSLNLPNAFLAILSACETAKGDTSQPDQAVHLAATMLYVGFKSVVGTMWLVASICVVKMRLISDSRSMKDADGPLVVPAIYEQLFRGNSEFLDPVDVPYALDDAVQKLRQKGVHPARWAPFIHIGL
jgi:hypothetical protein